MTTDPFWYTFDQGTKKFARRFDQGTKKFARIFDQGTKKFWRILSQPTDGTLPIRARKHWVVPLIALLPAIGIIIAALWLSLLVNDASWRVAQWFLWFVAWGTVLHFAWRALRWWKDVVTVTHKSFTVNKGLFWTTNSSIPITKVNDHNFKMTPFGKVLGYGTLTVESAGPKHGQQKIEYLPRQFYPIIKDLLDEN